MPAARIRRRLLRADADAADEYEYSEEYELVSGTDTNEFILRDSSGNITVFDAGGLYADIEIRCDACGRWRDHVAPSEEDAAAWVCYGGALPCGVE